MDTTAPLTTAPDTVLVNGFAHRYANAAEAADQAARWIGQGCHFGRREDGTWTMTIRHELTTWTVMGFDHQPTTEVAERVGTEPLRLWEQAERHAAILAAFPQ